MQKNLLVKTLSIIAILIIFVYGIFGIPGRFNLDGLKEALLKRISLGLDLKGGTHLILQVHVDEAVNAETDHTLESLREQLQKANVAFADITKPDPVHHPEQIEVKGISADGSTQLHSILNDQFSNYDVTGNGDTYTISLKPTAITDLKTRTVEQSIEAIRMRVDGLGVSEPVVEEHGVGDYQILVQLPGIDDPTRVKDVIKSTARLEIHPLFDGIDGYPTEQAARDAHGGVLPPNTIILPGRDVNPESQGQERFFIVGRIPVVGGTDIRHAEPSRDDRGLPSVAFNLSAAAGNKFAAFTAAHNEGGTDPNHFLAIVLDDKVREAASIKTEIHDNVQITGNFSEQYTKDLSLLLNSGSLPASISYIDEETVGPSLGIDSIRKGVQAAVAGMLAVMIFMLVYYKGAGINADLALFLNLVILLGFMGFTGATLTLPGIAGVILTVGMGVDSNVLIFERIREELRHGKAPSAAVDQGFARAWVTIIDTHVTTIVSAFILFIFGTGPVRGFAVTLTFGLLANLFTAVFVSRVIFDAVLTRKQRGEALSI
jgi:preprotein translocase subunit SecD